MLTDLKQDILRHKLQGKLLSYYPSAPVEDVSNAANQAVLDVREHGTLLTEELVTKALSMARDNLLGPNSDKL